MMQRFEKEWVAQLLYKPVLPGLGFAEKPEPVPEPPKFKVGDCVKYRMLAGGGIGYIARAATDDERGDWLCKWTHGTEETYKDRDLEHYLVPGDKVEPLPVPDWPENSKLYAGQVRRIALWYDGTVVRANGNSERPQVNLGLHGSGFHWPLSRVKKL